MDYSFKSNTYLTVPKDNPRDRISVEIGDSKEPDIILPQQKIMRWDNECNVSIRLKDFDEYSVYQDKDKVIFGNEKQEVHIYPITEGEGGQEFEVILNEKPLTNVIEFSLVDKDVEYFYQPELTAEEILKGASRPENVVGSYAVYASENKINYVDGKEYKVGKVGHIFRPKIIDSVGTEVWGELHIENGILSVTIPQDYLDKAVYPVRHAAGLTFGYDGAGNSSRSSRFESGAMGSVFTTSGQSGTVISMGMTVAVASGTQGMKVGIYDNAAKPNLITNGLSNENTTSNTSKHLETLTFGTNPSIVDTTTYSLCFGKSSGTDLFNWYYDASGSEIYGTSAIGTSPLTFGGGNMGTSTNKYTIYCTYTTGDTTTSTSTSTTTVTTTSTSQTTTTSTSSTSSSTSTSTTGTTISSSSSSSSTSSTSSSSSTSHTTSSSSSSTSSTSSSSSTSSTSSSSSTSHTTSSSSSSSSTSSTSSSSSTSSTSSSSSTSHTTSSSSSSTSSTSSSSSTSSTSSSSSTSSTSSSSSTSSTSSSSSSTSSTSSSSSSTSTTLPPTTTSTSSSSSSTSSTSSSSSSTSHTTSSSSSSSSTSSTSSSSSSSTSSTSSSSSTSSTSSSISTSSTSTSSTTSINTSSTSSSSTSVTIPLELDVLVESLESDIESAQMKIDILEDRLGMNTQPLPIGLDINDNKPQGGDVQI